MIDRLSLLRRLPIYRTRPGLVWPLVPFLVSGNYSNRMFAVPDTGRELFAARQQVEDQISVPAGAYLVLISANTDKSFPSDFRFQIQDQGSGATLGSDFLRYMAGTGGAANLKYPGRPLPLILPAPWIVTEPGIVSVRIVNQATVNANIRLLLQFAVPRKVL